MAQGPIKSRDVASIPISNSTECCPRASKTVQPEKAQLESKKQRYDDTSFTDKVNKLKIVCKEDVINFQAGRLQYFKQFWSYLSSDPWVVNTVSGMKIELTTEIEQTQLPRPMFFSEIESEMIDEEIQKMLKKGIIEPVAEEFVPGEYISNIFIRPKKDKGIRVILNLKEFNKDVLKQHFKMQTLQAAVDLMVPGAYMASIDFKDAYFSVPIRKEDQKYLRFYWRNQKYTFTVLPNGLSSGPRDFTKLTKVLFSYLKKRGYLNTIYIDDSFCLGYSYQECCDNVLTTVDVSRKAGFVVHPDKSVFFPTQVLVFLGFILNSIDMTIRLTKDKIEKLKKLISKLLYKTETKIKEVSEVVGSLVATFPGVKYGKLYYRQLSNEQSKALKESKGDFESRMIISVQAKNDLTWWLHNLEQEFVSIVLPIPDISLKCDASDIGWGGLTDVNKTGGQWKKEEQNFHINVKELLAILYSLQSLCGKCQNITIKILSDNTTAVNYVNNMGGTKQLCNSVARKIWEWAKQRSVWLLAAHLPGKLNVEADKLSRTLHSNIEWSLDQTVFQQVVTQLGPIEFDLFASRLNNQVPKYSSWMPDPGAKVCDAFSFSWNGLNAYAFPPFALISKVLRKVEQERCSIVLVVPDWPSQPWFPKFMRMSKKPMLSFSNSVLHNPVNMKEEKPRKKILICRVEAVL